ncbi:MAG: hypothetical protein Q8N36_03515, partial [bacterium]|nr:hypothetical protein [bacterium]
MGVSNGELFRQTFFVEQPLPTNSGLSEEVKQLLSGGGEKYSKVLDDLIGNLKGITRYWSLYSKSRTNGTKNQKLEEQKEKRECLTRELDLAKGASTNLQKKKVTQAELNAEYQVAVADNKDKGLALDMFKKWQAYKERTFTFRERTRLIKNAVQVLDDNEKKRQKAVEQNVKSVEKYKTEIGLIEQSIISMARYNSLGEAPVEQLSNTKQFLVGAIEKYNRWYELAQEIKQQQENAVINFSGGPHLAYDEKIAELNRLMAEAKIKSSHSMAVVAFATGIVIVTAIYRRFLTSGVGVAVLLLILLGFLVYNFQRRQKERRASVIVQQIQAEIDKLNTERASVLETSNKVSGLNAHGKVLREQLELDCQSILEMKSRPLHLFQILSIMNIEIGTPEQMYQAASKLSEQDWYTLEQNIKNLLDGQRQMESIIAAYEENQREFNRDREALDKSDADLLKTGGAFRIEDMRRLLDSAEEERLLCRKEWRDLISEYPGLPGIEQGEDIILVTKIKNELEVVAAQAKERVASLENQIFNTRSAISSLEGQTGMNIAASQEELQNMALEEEQLEVSAQSTGMAIEVLKWAINDFQGSYSGRLADAATAHFQAIARSKRKVVVGSN